METEQYKRVDQIPHREPNVEGLSTPRVIVSKLVSTYKALTGVLVQDGPWFTDGKEEYQQRYRIQRALLMDILRELHQELIVDEIERVARVEARDRKTMMALDPSTTESNR